MKQTDKSRYPSKYSPGKYVTAAQYILELVCEHKAVVEKTDLPIHFWNLPEWAGWFKQQLRICHKLLKDFDEKAIIKALNDPRCKTTYSLRAAWLMPVIEEYQRKLSSVVPVATEINRDDDKKIRTVTPKPNILSRLD